MKNIFISYSFYAGCALFLHSSEEKQHKFQSKTDIQQREYFFLLLVSLQPARQLTQENFPVAITSLHSYS
jgi:hypothetical protein